MTKKTKCSQHDHPSLSLRQWPR